MNCPSCGTNLQEDMTSCNICGEKLFVNFKKLITISILSCFINIITGIIAIFLCFRKLRPSINEGNLSKSLKIQKSIKRVLWIGIILFIISIFAYFCISHFIIQNMAEDLFNEPQMVEMPNLVGKSYQEAVNILEDVNLGIKNVKVSFDSKYDNNEVIYQSPIAGMEVKEGSDNIVLQVNGKNIE